MSSTPANSANSANALPARTAGSADHAACGGPADLTGPVSLALSRVARLHRTAAGRHLRALGLYPGQEFVMMQLWDKGPVRQSELIKAVELDPSTVTKTLQRLEQAGHVRRSPDPCDRRAVLVEATEESSGLWYDVAGAWGALEEQTLSGLSARDRDEFTRLLALVERNLCTEPEACPKSSE
ncbi:MarR family transcriptional regulator [Streptomyces sp. NPDC050264]|uniref:MarR family winged helix-turn-helix transcriptional regulator n=1 Tax=Streptomyces sp. NPDC050264 TaxID=3155038 RepID=UPI0034125193